MSESKTKVETTAARSSVSKPPRDERGRRYEYGRWYPPVAVKEAVRPLAKAWADVQLRLEALSDADLALVIEGMDEKDFTSMNCWWAEFQVLRAFEQRIRAEKKRRENAAAALTTATSPKSPPTALDFGSGGAGGGV